MLFYCLLSLDRFNFTAALLLLFEQDFCFFAEGSHALDKSVYRKGHHQDEVGEDILAFCLEQHVVENRSQDRDRQDQAGGRELSA